MNRDDLLLQAQDRRVWDLLVIGGGATGLGVAVDAAARGYAVLLVERDDFAKGTSSRSTKLVHGGVRYLQQGNLALVMEALRERGLLRQNAPHLVHDLAFVVPNYAWWEAPFYGVGLKMYDLLAGEYGFGASSHLSRDQVLAAIPTIETHDLKGGTRYYDGQFDDARLALQLARTAHDHGAVVLNYVEVTALTKDAAGQVHGATLRDHEAGAEFAVQAKAVINACGPFCDHLRHLDQPDAPPLLAPSQGVHVVLDADFLPGQTAIMVPHTSDGRVLFAIPWQQRVLLGTTDTPRAEVPTEPLPLAGEVEFIVSTANHYLARHAGRSDIKAVFTGIRPLVRAGAGGGTARLSRDHSILVDPRSGLISVAGGKWTTYRRMAEDVVDLAAMVAGLPPQPCPTRQLPIRGHDAAAARWGDYAHYGADAPELLRLLVQHPAWGARLQPALPLTAVEVVYACRAEMARRIEDVLSRRSRSLLLDAAAAVAAAPQVAALMAQELGRDATWQADQVQAFSRLALAYQVADE